MARADRIKLIGEIEALRKSRVVCIVTGDRPQLDTRIAMDIVPLMARHLRGVGKQERIDLFLYTAGGDVMAGFRLVNLIREYCSHFAVLIPFRCQSTGTLISLGADEIVMLPEGQLSPVDPSINGPYNPLIPGVPVGPGIPLQTLPVSVEEVMSYIRLASEVGLKGEESIVPVFERLTQDVRPLALGQVFRARTQIRMLSRKLLQLHMSQEDVAIDSIVETLTEKLYSHDYLIARKEAKAIGLKVAEPVTDLELKLSQLYDLYETDLELRHPFNPMALLARTQPAHIAVDRAYLETVGRCDVYRTEQTLQQHPQGVQAIPIFEGWKDVQ